MSTKAFIASASGLNNIYLTDSYREDFRFILYDKEIKMKRLYADFISPLVSNIHQTDPTIDSICLNDVIDTDYKLTDLIDSEFITKINEISKGIPVEIDFEMSNKIRIFSILIRNEELFKSMNSLYPVELNEKNADLSLQYLQYFSLSNQKESFGFNNEQIIEFISSHFYLIDESKLLKLPKSILYQIITNPKLKVKNEDKLFEFITELFSNGDDKDFNVKDFYEQIDITALSKEKFSSFIELIEPNEITSLLWNKLKNCFYSEFKQKINESRYSEKLNTNKITTIEYDDNPRHRFNGIISYLGKDDPKSVIANGIISVTASSIYLNDQYKEHQPKNVVDFNNDKMNFISNNDQNSWLLYDFKQRKVKPSHYSIKSHHWGGKGNYHPQNWRIEGSNDNVNWNVLDTRSNEKSLDDKSVSNTFTIKNDFNDFFRYLRIALNGVSTRNDHFLCFSSLEYFGSILE